MSEVKIHFVDGKAQSVSNQLIAVNDGDGNPIGEFVETTEEELSDVFASAGVEDLAGADEPIEAAVEDPLSYRDYLILADDKIVFDEDHERSEEE